jgi:hypothetical protein
VGRLEQAAPGDPLATAGGEGRRVEPGVAVPRPLGEEVGIVGEASAGDRRGPPRPRALRPSRRRDRQVQAGAQVDLGRIALGEPLLHPLEVVGPGLRPPAPVGHADEPRQGRLDAVVERPPPAHRAGPAGDGLGPEVGRAGRRAYTWAQAGQAAPASGWRSVG